ncbi:MAG: helix-turn-helix transcriptional regulator, partial [Candidatus Competibacteraceae bacterium]|nr:helix-turn-helix transcriptional regulator [Candidatus Competibacteraceae bacterium]
SFAAESATKIITLLGARKQPPLVVTVRAIGNTRSSQLGSGQSLAALVINNPATVQDSHDCALTQLYQLTPAQTRLTTLIVAGHTLAHAARELKVSENTVRSHLKQIFQKTETHSQMELVHLHTRICIG